MPEYWQALGKRFTGKGFDDFRGVRFEDINGDVRANPSQTAQFISSLIVYNLHRDATTGSGSTTTEPRTHGPTHEAAQEAKKATDSTSCGDRASTAAKALGQRTPE
jgi:hypothetical protein